MNRVSFLIDGFNLYHSLRQAGHHLRGASTKWLDLRALCSSYLHRIGSKAQLLEIYYFSALAKHLEATNPDVTRRHQCLLDCFQIIGIRVELARFKRKDVKCHACGHLFDRYEEKETDVAIAVKLLELFYSDMCDTAALVTGDTDVAPAIRTAQRLFPQKHIVCVFPYLRKNNELADLVQRSFVIKREDYARFQLPDPFICPDGRAIQKPASW
jgi:uncharacterized LabA/DUF88 family protein